jgi:proton-dependent oligopeptide transporter, POT family
MNVPESPPRVSFVEQVKEFRRPFWAANVMELIERLAYYGVRVVVPIYIASSEDPAGLHFTNTDKGIILTAWALIQTLVPMFSGGFADRYGRKRTIAISIAIKMVGYLLMATERSFWGFFLGCQVLALGTAIFKPGVQGTLVRGTTRKNSSLGWGFFYQVVNIGGWLGPPLAGYLHHYAWKWVFFSCAAIVSLNFITLLLYTDEASTEDADDPVKKDDAAERAMAERTPLQVFVYSVRTLFRPRLLAFILVMSGFWVMFMQLYDALPNFIEEWTNSRDIVAALGLREGLLAQPTPRGLQVPQEWLINLDATAIVLLMIPIALLTARLRRLVAIFVGIFIACGGLLLAGVTMSGWACIAGIFVFAIGEMVASPKMNEYLGVIAPRGEEALYMGYANVPLAVGWTSGAYVAGVIYDRLADKANLATRYLREQLHYTQPIERTDAMKVLQEVTHQDATQATHLLWTTYHPYTFWYLFVAVGMASAIGMVIYARVATRWTLENA